MNAIIFCNECVCMALHAMDYSVGRRPLVIPDTNPINIEFSNVMMPSSIKNSFLATFFPYLLLISLHLELSSSVGGTPMS